MSSNTIISTGEVLQEDSYGKKETKGRISFDRVSRRACGGIKQCHSQEATQGS